MIACKFIHEHISYTGVYPWELVAKWLKASAMYADGRGFDCPPPAYSLIFSVRVLPWGVDLCCLSSIVSPLWVGTLFRLS